MLFWLKLSCNTNKVFLFPSLGIIVLFARLRKECSLDFYIILKNLPLTIKVHSILVSDR